MHNRSITAFIVCSLVWTESSCRQKDLKRNPVINTKTSVSPEAASSAEKKPGEEPSAPPLGEPESPTGIVDAMKAVKSGGETAGGDPDAFNAQYLNGKAYAFCSPLQGNEFQKTNFTFTSDLELVLSSSVLSKDQCTSDHKENVSGPVHLAASYKVRPTAMADTFMILIQKSDGGKAFYLARFADDRLALSEQQSETASPLTFKNPILSSPAINEVTDPKAFAATYLGEAFLKGCVDEGTGSKKWALKFDASGQNYRASALFYTGRGCVPPLATNPAFVPSTPTVLKASAKPGVFILDSLLPAPLHLFQILSFFDAKLHSDIKPDGGGNDLEFTEATVSSPDRSLLETDLISDLLVQKTFKGCRNKTSSGELVTLKFLGEAYEASFTPFASTTCAGMASGLARAETGTIKVKGPLNKSLWNLTLTTGTVITHHLLKFELNQIILSQKPSDSGTDLALTSPLFLKQQP